MKQVLIIKTSALGDVIHTLPLLDALRYRYPEIGIDWVVEESIAPLLRAHPLVRRSIPIRVKEWRKQFFSLSVFRSIQNSLRELREEEYDLVIDLQGNCKSGLFTLLARGKQKIGLSLGSVREWPNILTTHKRFSLPKEKNIRLQYLSLLDQYFGNTVAPLFHPLALRLDQKERETLETILSSPALQRGKKIMVCPGSKWKNKQLPLSSWIEWLSQIARQEAVSFIFIGGSQKEKEEAKELQERFPEQSLVAPTLSLPAWQSLMGEMDLVMGVDSSALHLAGTTNTPTFSVFGPTSPAIFAPLGTRHQIWQGKCPYGERFVKQCPHLRTCQTGACMRDFSPCYQRR